MATKRKVVQIKPSAAAHEKLDSTFARLRQLAGEGENTQVTMMLLLLELYEHKEIWQSRYPTWDELLKEEGFTTAHTFTGFQKALGDFGEVEVRRLGVRASTLMIRLPKATRVRVLGAVNEWMKTHPIPPTYQRVTTYTKLIVGTRPKAKESKDEQVVRLQKRNTELVKSNKLLTDHNKVLRTHLFRVHGLLRRNKIEAPKMPEME